MKPTDSCSLLQRGLTLIELVVAMAVAGILMTAAYGIFLVQQKTYAVQDQMTQTQQNARVAMNVLARDLRMAGHGVPLLPITIGGEDHRNIVSVGVGGSDLTLLGCFGAPEGYLSKSAGIGAVQIDLRNTDEADKFDEGSRKYIFIGEYDKAVVVGKEGKTLTLAEGLKKRYPTTRLTERVDAGKTRIQVADTSDIYTGDILTLGDEVLYVTGIAENVIDFDTDPTTPLADPIQNKYEKDTIVNPIPVFRVQAVRYFRDADERMRREDLSGGGGQALAENIWALKVTPEVPPDNPTYQIVLTARSDVPDKAGNYRTRTYNFSVARRNF